LPKPSDRLAIVTGTSSGIGRAVADELLRRDWTVVGVSRRPVGFEHPGYQHLILDLRDLAALASRLESELGPTLGAPTWRRIGLVNNAATADPLEPLERVDPVELNHILGLNLVAPIWLMGLVVRRGRPEAALRIVNVSSGAATQPFPGLGGYAAAKAALRMAGMVLAVELASPLRPEGARADAAILSYEPGIVDTEMQTTARSRSPAAFPWVGMFTGFARDGQLIPPSGPAGEIADFLDGDFKAGFAERRIGG